MPTSLTPATVTVVSGVAIPDLPTATTTIRLPHTFGILNTLVNGVVKVSFSVDLPTGQTAALVKAKYITTVGTVTVQIRKNASAAGMPAAIAVTTTEGSTDFADVTIATGDRIDIELSNVAGSAANLSFTLFADYTSTI